MLRNCSLVIAFLLSCTAFMASGVAQSRLDEAITKHTRTIKLDPRNVEAYLSRGDAYKEKGEYDAAIADYSRAIELDPNNLAAHNNRGVAYSQKRDPERAIADFTRAIALDSSGGAMIYSNRGSLYAQKGEYDRAMPDLNRAIELSPNNYNSYFNRGVTLEDMGANDAALADYNRAIELAPTMPKPHRARGFLFYGRGDYARASSDLLRAAERHDDPYTHIFRYLALTRQGENAVAELARNAARLTASTWPSAMIDLYLGKQTPDATLGTASTPEERCEAQFYLGQWAILQKRVAEAEAPLRKAAETCPKTFPEYKIAQADLNRLSTLSVSPKPALTAEDFAHLDERAVQFYRDGKYKDAVEALNQQVIRFHEEAKYKEGASVAEKAFALAERTLGPEHPSTTPTLSNLARLYQAQGRYSEAEPLYKRALAANERLPADPNAFLSVNEPGRDHAATLVVVNNLAELYRAQGRDAEAEPLLKRALAGRERALGPEHPDTLRSRNNLAAMYQMQGRHKEADVLYQATLEAKKRKLGAENPATLRSGNNRATLLETDGRHDEAEALYREVIAGWERVAGPEHPDMLRPVANLALLYHMVGRYAEAEALNKHAIDGYDKALGPDHPDTLLVVDNLAGLYFVQRDWARAAALWRRSTAAIIARTRREDESSGQPLIGAKQAEAQQRASEFRHLIKVTYRLEAEGRGSGASALRDMFTTAQWALSSQAARSLAQMAARSARGNAVLAALIRERQDLVAEWQKGERVRNAALAQEAGKRDAAAQAENDARLTAIDAQVAAIDQRLAGEFPDYAQLATATPLSIDEVQRNLAANEALVLFLDTPESKPTPAETFIWVVTKSAARWVRSDIGGKALAAEVQALRCGLDAAAWQGSHCQKLTGASYRQADASGGKPLPFDSERAHRLYKALFGAVENLIADKHLLIVPSGPLTQLPFQVLVTAPSVGDDYRSTAWLARRHALSVLPAVSSLKALRAVGRRSGAAKPVIGFGNPLLDGSDETDAPLARLAREKQNCGDTIHQQAAAILGFRGAAAFETRAGLANVSLIREQIPLPETVDELCAVARDFGADLGDIRLGAAATEREVKTMSGRGALAQYRIVYFATHGAMAGELKGSIEPGLILTPPQTASEVDDGYLSASEIADLRLDADWVILSACNTAAGDAASAEALSGLARAFIYAQARALLVSHWAVNSDATVKLVTGAIGALSRDSSVGRAEALRRAMLELIDNGTPQEAHPTYWAPFMVVGEGGR
jgi:tetratricopeptide (TPR) repeat protein